MQFEQHAFISYAHIDDQPLSPEQRGWVTRFHATLQALLSMRIGSPAQIWRDDRLHGNDAFPDEIIDQFDRTAMLISVLTPRYVASEWCTRELKVFCDQAERLGGLRLQNKSRIFKVLKSPLDDESGLPPSMRDLLGYPFFVVEDGAPMELDAAYGETYAQDYNRRVCKLAWDISRLLKELEGVEPPPQQAASTATKALTVYLAECSHDGRPARERIQAELHCQGHTVLPDRRIDCDEENACEQQVRDWLARCDLAVHLVGRSGGPVPDGSRGEPLVPMQNRVAAERSAACGMPRLIWLPADTPPAAASHQAFVDALRSDAGLQRGADLLVGGLDEFVQALHATVDRLTRPPPEPVCAAAPDDTGATAGPKVHADADADAALSVYLVCTSADRKPSLPLRRWLRDRGIDVEMPAFEGSAADVRASHCEMLTRCDAVIVYYGAGDEAWKRGVDGDLKKQRGLLDRTSPLQVFTVLADPSSGDKEDLVEIGGRRQVDARGETLPEAALEAVVAEIRAAAAAATAATAAVAATAA